MQKSKINKLKWMMDVSSTTPPMLRKDGQKSGAGSRHIVSREVSQSSSVKALKRRKSQPNRDSKKNFRDFTSSSFRNSDRRQLNEDIGTSDFGYNRKRNSEAQSLNSRESQGALSREYKEYANRRDSKMSQELAKAHLDRSISRERSFVERAA